MHSFNVLDRSQKIHRNYLLEASAGTGKTFSIENIVVRLLIEEKDSFSEPLKIEQILVVTFTRAAMRDLKMRVRSNIEKNLALLQCSQCERANLIIFDYLQAHIEKGEEAIHRAKKRLEQALFCFDQAQIFTIHGFCSRMLRDYLLEGNISFENSEDGKEFSETQIIKIVRDFFRTELTAEQYSSGQLKIVLEEYQGNTEKLEQALLKVIKNGLDIEDLPHFYADLSTFKQTMHDLKIGKGYSSEKIVADFILQAPAYNEICDRKRVIKPKILDKVHYFAKLFDQQEWSSANFDQLLEDQLCLVELLHPSKLSAHGKPPSPSSLHYPDLLSVLQNTLSPLVKRASSALAIFARMACGCQKMLRKYQNEEEKLGFDDYLKAMLAALKNPIFTDKVRGLYQTAIIDEFQDTDPIQWEIFNTLFLSRKTEEGNLYLVGDPKQSIYAFRQADIYTYLKAATAIGENNRASLDTNFRSQSSLVHALNVLFSHENSPGLIALPRINQILEYQPVKASQVIEEKIFTDTHASVHFCIAEPPSPKNKNLPLEKLEKHYFFPFFTAEVQRLHAQDGVRYGQFAILVSDRFQAERAGQFLKEWGIPTVLQRSASLSDALALPALRELLQAVLHPRHESSLKTALGGHIIGWTNLQVRLLDEHLQMEQVLIKFYALRNALVVHGFASFFEQLLQSCWHDSAQTVAEILLARKEGLSFYQDLQQIAGLLFEFQSENHAPPEALLTFLDQFPLLEINDDERIKSRPDPSQDAVNILTLHSSKGLEFDIVFALGLIKRSSQPATLLPIVKDNCTTLCALDDKESEVYQKYCHENDAEKIRQLYVALTRAKYRLYIPVTIFSEGKEVELGSASPMELFLARLGKPLLAVEELYEQINQFDSNHFFSFLNHSQTLAKISYTRLSGQPIFLEMQSHPTAPQLIEPPDVHVPGQKQFFYSYTTLSKSGQGRPAKKPLEDLVSFFKKPPHDYLAEIKNAHTLPSGSDIGNLFHLIFENIPFYLAKEGFEAILLYIRPFLATTPFSPWEQVIAEIVWNALRLPLQGEDHLFCLEDICLEHCYREIEFFYPCQGMPILEDLECSSGFLKGVIDLIFWHKGKYYLIDWKSNWLGPELKDYSQESMQAAMHEHGYFLQAAIYKEALQRYLRVVDDRTFAEIFGGTFYIFLRGVSSHCGVFCHKLA